MQLLAALEAMKGERAEIPLVIGGKPLRTGKIINVPAPHEHNRSLAHAHLAKETELRQAVEAACAAHDEWASMDGHQRAQIFLKAADILSGPRQIENIAAIMMNLSKTPFEAEIDLIELVDFWRFNAYYMEFLYDQQPSSGPGENNRFDWRPLEGFITAVTPFNFVAIAGNLPSAPAQVGNVVLWKPSRSVILANYCIMQILQEAGLPDGAINFVPSEAAHFNNPFNHPSFAGLHFTGSSETMVQLWQRISANLNLYRSFTRIVGEAAGKDFIVVHRSAVIDRWIMRFSIL